MRKYSEKLQKSKKFAQIIVWQTTYRVKSSENELTIRSNNYFTRNASLAALKLSSRDIKNIRRYKINRFETNVPCFPAILTRVRNFLFALLLFAPNPARHDMKSMSRAFLYSLVTKTTDESNPPPPRARYNSAWNL